MKKWQAAGFKPAISSFLNETTPTYMCSSKHQLFCSAICAGISLRVMSSFTRRKKTPIIELKTFISKVFRWEINRVIRWPACTDTYFPCILPTYYHSNENLSDIISFLKPQGVQISCLGSKAEICLLQILPYSFLFSWYVTTGKKKGTREKHNVLKRESTRVKKINQPDETQESDTEKLESERITEMKHKMDKRG